MQVKISHPTTTEARITVIATEKELQAIKTHVLGHYQGRVKVPGFRSGNVPPAILEKHLDPNSLQTDFLEEGIQQLFSQAVQAHKLRPVGQPEINITKFVPYETLEFEAKMPVIGEVKLADYKKLKKAKPIVKLTAADVSEVLESLRERVADHVDVERAAKTGDKAWIDFRGVDAKGEPVNGADGKDYPLVLGSNTFIPGFEENLIGMKANEEKTFTLTFPKDYGVKALAHKKVTFTVTVTKVQEIKKPQLDDAFAAKAGPFKNLAELKADIKKQVTAERQREAEAKYQAELVDELAMKSTLDVPQVLVEDQIDRMEQDERQNLMYRGKTWEDHLKEEGVTADEHREQKREQAALRVKASLVLAEVAEAEGLIVSDDELEVRMQLLRQQYQDPQMQAELAKPEARRDVASRILTEKTLEKLASYASKNAK
jgi:trigger factor